MKPGTITLEVNGRLRSATAEPRLTLLDFLRYALHLTGTHMGCEHGVCGACTVRFDGSAVRSCLMYAFQAPGHHVTTVEGSFDGASAPARSSSGIVAALVTGLLSGVFWVIFGLYCFKTDSWSGRIVSLFFAGLASSLFGLAVRAAILLRRFPPTPDQNVVTDEFLEEYRTRRRSGH